MSSLTPRSSVDSAREYLPPSRVQSPTRGYHEDVNGRTSSRSSSQRALERGARLAGHASNMIAEDDSDRPLPNLNCLRGQMVGEYLPVDEPSSNPGVEGDEHNRDPPPNYVELNPPAPSPECSTLGAVQYANSSEDDVSIDSSAATQSLGSWDLQSRLEGRRGLDVPGSRYVPRAASPLRNFSSSQDFEDFDGTDGDISSSPREGQRRRNPYMTGRFASTETDLMGNISRCKAEVSTARPQDSEESLSTDSTASESSGDLSVGDKLGKWVKKGWNTVRGHRNTVENGVRVDTVVRVTRHRKFKNGDWILHGMDPIATPSTKNEIPTASAQASSHHSAASLHGTLPRNRSHASSRSPSLVPTPFTLPPPLPSPITPVSHGHHAQGISEKRRFKIKDNIAHSMPTKLSQVPRASLDSNSYSSKSRRSDVRPRNNTPASLSSGHHTSSGRQTPSSRHTGTSQLRRSASGIPTITAETIIEHMGGRPLSTFLRGGSDQPIAVLKQFLQAVMGASMASHLDEHATGNVDDQSIAFGDFVNCTGCRRLLAIAMFACGREIDQWSKSKDGPPTLLDFLA